MAQPKAPQRSFGPSNFAVDNRTSMFLLTAIIFLFGLQAYNSMPKESFPEIVIPTIYIGTTYAGNSAEDMENLVTKPLEEELASISGIKKLEGTSIQDFSNIIVEFNTSVSVDKALREVKDAVDKAKSDKNFPKDLTSGPNVFEINFSEFPILTINLSGQFSEEELRRYAEDLETEIKKLPEISDVKLKGTSPREVRIDVDYQKMQSRQVSFGDIANAVAMENMTMSAGERRSNDFRRSVRVVGEFKDISEIENLIVKSEFQNTIFLRDIAKVYESFAEASSVARSDGAPVVSLDIIKKGGKNLLSAADQIKLILAQAQAERLPKSLKVTLFNDQSKQVRDQVANLQNSIISGILLVVLVLLFFLGLRSSLFVGLAIPISMLMGILTLNLLGITLNMVVLFALILALGMLVDNSIVTVENIYRLLASGKYDQAEASKQGAGEIALPIISSTATTLAAFIPLMFWPGIMGEFMKYLPITLVTTLVSSLFVALVLTPVFTARFMQVENEEDSRLSRRALIMSAAFSSGLLAYGLLSFGDGTNISANLSIILGLVFAVFQFILRPASAAFQSRVLPILEVLYERFIAWTLRGFLPYFLFLGMFGLLFGSLALLGAFPPKVIFFPAADPEYVNAFVELPMGTDIRATNRFMKEIETKVGEAIKPYQENGIVEAVLSQIGENTSDPAGPPEPGATPNKARLTVSFVPTEDRNGISTYDVMEAIRKKLQGYAGVKIIVDRNQSGPPTGKPINLEISADDQPMSELTLRAQAILAYLKAKNVPGVEELNMNITPDVQQDLVEIDKEAARRYGLSTYDIAMALRTALYGNEVGQFKKGDDEYPIMVRFDEQNRQREEALLNQVVTFRNMAAGGRIVQIPISAVARIKPSTTYNAIKRKNERRTITIYSNVLQGYNPNEIVEELKRLMADYPMPKGYNYRFTGEQEEQAEAMAFLSSALMIGVVSIFFIIVLQFNSLLSPFIILLSVFFSTIGVFLGYIITGMDLVIVMTGIGIISLAGVVVNNAIVLIDFTNFLQAQTESNKGRPVNTEEYKAILAMSGRTRLRPVLLTAITTVLGLIPLATGFNFDFITLVTEFDPNIYIGGDSAAFWGAMSWTVIYGLIFATFLTLVVVPIMCLLAFQFQRGLAALWQRFFPT